MKVNTIRPAASLASASSPPTLSLAELLRSGSAKTIQLPFEAPGVRLPGFTFHTLCCKYGAVACFPSPADLPALPSGIDVVLYPACYMERNSQKLSFGRAVFRYTRTWENFVVDINCSFEDYWNRFSSKSRWTIRSKARKLTLACGGTAEYRHYGSLREMAEFHEVAKTIKLGKYQQKVLHNTFSKESVFYEEMMQQSSRNATRGYLLWASGKAIAYLYCTISDGAILHESSGYDPEFARFSPGVLLQSYALRKLFAEENFTIFDFSNGGGQHKSFFSTRCMQRADLYFFRTTPRNLALMSLIASAEFASSKSRDIINGLGFEPIARRFLRWMKA